LGRFSFCRRIVGETAVLVRFWRIEGWFGRNRINKSIIINNIYAMALMEVGFDIGEIPKLDRDALHER